MAKRTRFSRKSKSRRFPARQVGRSADMSTPPASKIFTSKGQQIRPCFKKGRGKSELLFLSSTDAERYGLKPGPTVRLCSASKTPGHLVHVANPCQAQAVAKAWTRCSKAASGSKQLEACAVEARSQKLVACPREDYATLHGMDAGARPARPAAKARPSGQLARDWDRAARLKR